MNWLEPTKRIRLFRSLSGLVLLIAWLAIGQNLAGADISLPAPGEFVELPPYVVEEQLDPPWRYAAIPGVEVISRCQDSITSQLVDRHHRLGQLLTIIFPEELQPKRDAPFHYVFYPQSNQPEVARELVEQAQSAHATAASGPNPPKIDESLYRFMPNFRFVDQDSIAVFFVVNEFSAERSGFTLTTDYLSYLLDGSTPSLPRWFIEGMIELYPTIHLKVPPINTPINFLSTSITSNPSDSYLYDDAVFAPAIWISRAQTQCLKKEPDAAPPFIPLVELFNNNKFETRDPPYQALWLAESALFLRWALDPEKHKVTAVVSAHLGMLEGKFTQAQALWTFVTRARSEPVTEALFKDCFGQSFADAELRLRDYLPRAISSKFYLQGRNATETPEFSLRDATKLDISRIKGGLARLEIGYVQARYPHLTNRYVEQARRTLRIAYDLGERDPRLLAELGLCECDAGNDAGAEPFLRAAVDAQVVKPMAYLQLARIEFDHIRNIATDQNSTAEQIKVIMELLNSARLQAPPIPAVYELYARVWILSQMPLGDVEFAILDEGMRYFPRQVRLIYASALLQAMQGDAESAQVLISQGLNLSVDPVEQALLRRLKTALSTNPDATRN